MSASTRASEPSLASRASRSCTQSDPDTVRKPPPSSAGTATSRFSSAMTTKRASGWARTSASATAAKREMSASSAPSTERRSSGTPRDSSILCTRRRWSLESSTATARTSGGRVSSVTGASADHGAAGQRSSKTVCSASKAMDTPPPRQRAHWAMIHAPSPADTSAAPPAPPPSPACSRLPFAKTAASAPSRARRRAWSGPGRLITRRRSSPPACSASVRMGAPRWPYLRALLTAFRWMWKSRRGSTMRLGKGSGETVEGRRGSSGPLSCSCSGRAVRSGRGS
mmetsp:Transcript_27990/g.82269  ORF Transcript_27990/g.82269 Transcript_27990/m.82269 type:complete len:283 (+) Transcript_27990:95-943(+)